MTTHAKDCDYDYIIVGAGPAGLQMAYFLQKSGRRYVIYEKGEKAANFFTSNPRHGKLISINKRYNFFKEPEFNMRHDWNSLLSDDENLRFTKYSDELYPNPEDLVRYMNDFAERFQLNIEYDSAVTLVSKQEGVFTARLQNGTQKTARCVLMATGAMAENLPDTIEGIELADTYGQHDADKEKYNDKLVLIVGGGNSAFETADALSGNASIVHLFGNKRFQFAWDTHRVGDLRAVNNNIIDMYHLKSLHTTVGTQVHKIEMTPEGKYLVTFKDLNTHWDVPGWLFFKMEYDHVISCCGWRYIKPAMFDSSIEIDTVKNDRYPALSNIWETKTENLFYIGTAMAAIDRQSASGFIHGFRYNIRSLFHVLEERFFNIPLHSEEMLCCLQTIAEKVVERSSVSDSLYQMNGFLCDVLLMDDNKVKYYSGLPRKYVMEREEFKSAEHVFVLHLSYGFDKFPESSKPVDNVHAPDFSTNRCASFLHPYIEYHSRGVFIDQTELQESLIARFDKWTCSNMPQWTLETNYNYVKHYVNEKMNWTKESFNLIPLPPHIAKQVFIPLTPEEVARIPPEWEPAECKPSRELKPLVSTKATRVLKPTPEDLMKSMKALMMSESKDPNGNPVIMPEP